MKMKMLLFLLLCFLCICVSTTRVSKPNSRRLDYKTDRYSKRLSLSGHADAHTDNIENEREQQEQQDISMHNENEMIHDQYKWQCQVSRGESEIMRVDFGYVPNVKSHSSKRGSSSSSGNAPLSSFTFRLLSVIEFNETNGFDGYQEGQDSVISVWNDHLAFDWGGSGNGTEALGVWNRTLIHGNDDNDDDDDDINRFVWQFHSRTLDSDRAAGLGQLSLSVRATTDSRHGGWPNAVNVDFDVLDYPWRDPTLRSDLAFKVALSTRGKFRAGTGATPIDIDHVRVVDNRRRPALARTGYAVDLLYSWRNRVPALLPLWLAFNVSVFDYARVHMGDVIVDNIGEAHQQQRTGDTPSLAEQRRHRNPTLRPPGHVDYLWYFTFLAAAPYAHIHWRTQFVLDYVPLHDHHDDDDDDDDEQLALILSLSIGLPLLLILLAAIIYRNRSSARKFLPSLVIAHDERDVIDELE